jgi:hypothetical protein
MGSDEGFPTEGDPQFSLWGPTGITQVSCSMIGSMQTCEASAYFNYWLKLPKKKRWFLERGSCFDKGITAAYNLSLSGKKKAKSIIKEAVEAAVESYKESHDSGIVYDKDASKDLVLQQIQDGVQIFLDNLGVLRVSPQVPPQSRITLEFKKENGVVSQVPFLCVIDAVTLEDDDTTVVRDTKTSSRAWPEGKADGGLQAPFYTSAVGAYLKKPVNSFRYDVIHFGNKAPSFRSYAVWVSPERQAACSRWAMAASDRMNAFMKGALPIPNRASYVCSRGRCDFWQACEEMFGPHVRE